MLVEVFLLEFLLVVVGVFSIVVLLLLLLLLRLWLVVVPLLVVLLLFVYCCWYPCGVYDLIIVPMMFIFLTGSAYDRCVIELLFWDVYR